MNSRAAKVNIFLVVTQLALVGMIALQWLEFGSKKGNWAFQYFIKEIYLEPFILVVLLAPIVLALAYLSLKLVDRPQAEFILLVLWVILSTLFQNAFRTFYPISFREIIVSDAANSFFTPTLRYSLYQFTKHFHELVPQMPLHVKTNMPGKTIFYFLLTSVANDPQAIGQIITLLSNAGGILLYWVTKQLLGTKGMAFQAFLLYLFIPARLFFFPLLNTISPLFILADLSLFLLFLNSRKLIFAFALGLFLYLTFMFDPLTLTTGIVFVGILPRYWARNKPTWRECAVMVSCVILGFALLHFGVLLFLGLDSLRAFVFVSADLRHFFAVAGRAYSIWLVHNLKEFFIAAGLPLSVLFLLDVASLVNRRQSKTSTEVAAGALPPVGGAVVAISLLVLVIVLDALGVNRGEVSRLWIFVAALLPITAVDCLSKLETKTPFYVCLGGLLLQGVITISAVAFVIP